MRIILIPAAVLTYWKMCLTDICSYDMEPQVSSFWECFQVLRVTAVFTGISFLMKKRIFHKKTRLFITEAGSCVFGIYLLEQTGRSLCNGFYYSMCERIPPYAAIWIYVLLVFMICLGIVYVLRKIPFIRKLI